MIFEQAWEIAGRTPLSLEGCLKRRIASLRGLSDAMLAVWRRDAWTYMREAARMGLDWPRREYGRLAAAAEAEKVRREGKDA